MDAKTQEFFSNQFNSTIEKLVAFADKESYDRDNLIQSFAKMFSLFVNISTFKNYKVLSSDDPAEMHR